MSPLRPLRVAKHQLLVGRRAAHSARVGAYDAAARLREAVRAYTYRPWALGDAFVTRSAVEEHHTEVGEVPRLLYCLWTRSNPMSEARHHGLSTIAAKNPHTDVVLITHDEVSTWVLAKHPLHPAYTHLSAVHRSDYLRAYLMHHHGGGYSDIKPARHCWDTAYTSLADDPGAWAVGYREIGSEHCADLPGPLGRALRRHHPVLLGNAAFVMRPGTPLTAEWLAEVERRLDRHLPALRGCRGSVWGDEPGYPVSWTELQASVLQPLCLKYHGHLRYDDHVRPQLHDHR